MSVSASIPHLGIVQGRPSTFAERGVCVPFTTPILAQSRVRMDRYEQLECLLPGFSGGKGIYVFGWRSLPEVVRVTMHDRALHREILESKANTPDTIRTAALNVAARGFAGLAAAAQAKAALRNDQDYVVLTNYVFVLELLRLVGVSAPDLLKKSLDSDNVRATTKRALNRVAEKFGMSADDLYARVETLSHSLSPIGLPQAPKPGRLRGLIEKLSWFRDDVTAWSSTEGTEASEIARFMADCAEQTLGLARRRLEKLEPLLAKIQSITTGEKETLDAIQSGVVNLSWLLDGWDYIVQLWEDAKHQSDDMQRIAMCEAFRIAPVIPMEEMASNENQDLEELRRVQKRFVRANQDWRTGSLDYDAIRRIEQLKAKLV